jgi:glycosyltransferase involved in cell wall biosynthesis
MARILSVVWYKILPATFGGQKGIAEFNEHLARRHELICLCASSNDPKDVPYKVITDLPDGKLQVLMPFNWMRILQAVGRHQTSHLLLEHCYYGIPAMLAKRFLKVRLILHAHNIEYQRFRDMGKWWWPLLKILELSVSRHADLLLFKTPEDLSHASKVFGFDPLKAMVVPFGINLSAPPDPSRKPIASSLIRQRHAVGEDERILLFTGTLDYAPNAAALEDLVTVIIPMLERMCGTPFRVIVCGRIRDPRYAYLRDLAHPKFTYAGEVDDLGSYLLSADLFLNPVCTGGGIKVKTMEALSHNLTVISTEHSARGIDKQVTGDKLQVVADHDWSAFCERIVRSLEIKSDTPMIFYERYGWASITDSVARRIDAL